MNGENFSILETLVYLDDRFAGALTGTDHSKPQWPTTFKCIDFGQKLARMEHSLAKDAAESFWDIRRRARCQDHTSRAVNIAFGSHLKCNDSFRFDDRPNPTHRLLVGNVLSQGARHPRRVVVPFDPSDGTAKEAKVEEPTMLAEVICETKPTPWVSRGDKVPQKMTVQVGSA